MKNDKFTKDETNNVRGKKRTRKRNSNNKRNCPKCGADVMGTDNGGSNDPSWYSVNAQLLEDAGSFSYAWPAGNKINIDRGKTPELSAFSSGGIASIGIMPTIGISDDQYSPVNVAARNIYTFVRHVNSGHTNYDAPDLMLYLLAMDSAYSMYAFMVRAYGCLQLYSQQNRYYPKALLESMCLDPDDLMANIADFRYFINAYAIKLGSLCVPASMSYFTRHIWMYSNVYMDDISSKAQLYVFNPFGFYKFDEFTENGGSLTFQQWWTPQKPNHPTKLQLRSLNTLKNYANQLLDAVLASEDMNIMSGDILKAFGDNGIFKIATISADYMVLPQYNQEVLSQIQNMSIMGFPDDDSYNITQNVGISNGAILYHPKWRLSAGEKDKRVSAVTYTKRLISMYKDNPTPGDNMVATRLTTCPNTIDKDGRIDYEHLGSEVAVTMRFACFAYDEVDKIWEIGWSKDLEMVNAIISDIATTTWIKDRQTLFNQVTSLSSWKSHPCLYLTSKIVSGSTVKQDWVTDAMLFDLNNYTLMDDHDLAKLHETALLSQFACPQMGAFSRKDTK